MSKSGSIALPRHQRTERRGTNKETTNAAYEITDASTKKCNRGNALEQSVGTERSGGGGGVGGGRWGGGSKTHLHPHKAYT